MSRKKEDVLQDKYASNAVSFGLDEFKDNNAH